MPVIFDDGGSTRIKQIKDGVRMDGLLDVFKDQADGRFIDGAGNFQCTMNVRFHEIDGDQHTPLVTVAFVPPFNVTDIDFGGQVVKYPADDPDPAMDA